MAVMKLRQRRCRPDRHPGPAHLVVWAFLNAERIQGGRTRRVRERPYHAMTIAVSDPGILLQPAPEYVSTPLAIAKDSLRHGGLLN